MFSDALICPLFMIKIFFKLPCSALQGFASFIQPLIYKLEKIPDCTSICIRAKKLALPKLSNKRAQVVAIDSSGVKISGEGEWKVKMHGSSKRRRWLNVHICIDPKSGDILAEKTTLHTVHDAEVVDDLLCHIPKSVKTVLGEGIYDGTKCRKKIEKYGAYALVPPHKNARLSYKDPDRDDAIKLIKSFGADAHARSLWGKLTGYSQRSLVKTAFLRMKTIFSPRLFSKCMDRQIVENHYRFLILNKMNHRVC